MVHQFSNRPDSGKTSFFARAKIGPIGLHQTEHWTLIRVYTNSNWDVIRHVGSGLFFLTDNL